MTDKQARFCDEYLIDLNATQAAIRAGYSPNSAQEQGSKLLSKGMVRARVDAAMAEQSRRTGINADVVLRELARIGRLNSGKVVNFGDATIKGDATEDDLAAIASVRVKTSVSDQGETVEREVKFHDKTKALELLGRHLGMFDDKLTVAGALPVKIVDDIPDASPPEAGEAHGTE